MRIRMISLSLLLWKNCGSVVFVGSCVRVRVMVCWFWLVCIYTISFKCLWGE